MIGPATFDSRLSPPSCLAGYTGAMLEGETATITCPACGHTFRETMPTTSCQVLL